MRSFHEHLEDEEKSLGEEVMGLWERDMHLVDDLNESLHSQDELKKLNQDHQIKADDAISQHLELDNELEEKFHQFESWKFDIPKRNINWKLPFRTRMCASNCSRKSFPSTMPLFFRKMLKLHPWASSTPRPSKMH
ncbi:unnamed protein product [Lactuca saligna]|uniref:Uncharacterized protein n=1 Tax=Lactuca saligna TaxID=75948 RepID=A0AA36DXV4_LACSI|nr:unnamed protein product [Lactuca saligna]